MAAVLTPCRTKGVVNFQDTRKLTHFLSSHGCGGLFVPSSTGEIFLLDDSVRRKLLAAAREGAESKAEIWAGTSGMGARHTIRLCKSAAQSGADGVIVMAPVLFKFKQAELEDYVLRIADASPLPVGIYHHLRMPTAFGVETVARLAAHPNIVLLKDTSSDLDRMKALVAATRGASFRLYQGNEHLVLSSLEAGAYGTISALANVLPELHRETVESFLAGNPDDARKAQETLTEFWKVFTQPETRESMSHFVRSLTLPLTWRGLFGKMADMHARPRDFAKFDRWLGNYYAENGLRPHLSPAA